MEAIKYVGLVVHYQPHGEDRDPEMAFITSVEGCEEDEVHLCVVRKADFWFSKCKRAEAATPGCWNWKPSRI